MENYHGDKCNMWITETGDVQLQATRKCKQGKYTMVVRTVTLPESFSQTCLQQFTFLLYFTFLAAPSRQKIHTSKYFKIHGWIFNRNFQNFEGDYCMEYRKQWIRFLSRLFKIKSKLLVLFLYSHCNTIFF